MTIPALTAAVSPQAALAVGWITAILTLVLLAAVVTLLVRTFLHRRAARPGTAPAAQAPEAVPVQVSAPAAPGSAGQLKLHDVEPRTAAMLMAIVADKTGKPLNELRFISIKEVK